MTLIDHPSPNHSERKSGVRVDTVLLHHTASANSAPALKWMCEPSSGVSAHYVIGPQGLCWQLVDERSKAWHAGLGRLPWETCKPYDFNHRSIGVELVNPGDGKTPFTEAQYRALAELLPDIVRRHRILTFPPMLPQNLDGAPCPQSGMVGILGHRDVACFEDGRPGRKTDPADNFDWGRVREMLAGRVA